MTALTGQPQASARLARAFERPSHAYLFVGADAQTKLHAARLLAQALLCDEPASGGCGHCGQCVAMVGGHHPDFHLWDVPEGEKTFKVDQVRELIGNVQRTPFQARRSVHVLAAVDAMAPGGANALLKTLEEPPPTAVLILLARDQDALLPTIVSRCQSVPFVAADAAIGVPAPALPEGPGLPAWQWAEKLAGLTGPEQQAQLTALLAAIRDVAGSLAGAPRDRLPDPGPADALAAWAPGLDAAGWVAVAELVERTRDRLERHAHARLALDELARGLVGLR